MGIDTAIFTPPETVVLGNQSIRFTMEHKDSLVTFGLPSVDKNLLPLWPGALLSLIASSSNGKSSTMSWWARKRANYLLRTGQADTSAVVYISTESPIEVIYKKWVANDMGCSLEKLSRGDVNEEEWARIEKYGIKHASMPLWAIGRSTMKPDPNLELNIDFIGKALGKIRNWSAAAGFRLDLVFIDHLQDIEDSRRFNGSTERFTELAADIKKMAMAYACPVVLGVQAKREVDAEGRKGGNPVPGKSDGMNTSKIEQASDVILTLCRPCLYRAAGKEVAGVTVEGDNQLIVSCPKQREGKPNWATVLYWKCDTNEIGELERKNLNV